jgi:hypothetical protein
MANRDTTTSIAFIAIHFMATTLLLSFSSLSFAQSNYANLRDTPRIPEKVRGAVV